jgi:protoporphyrinogen oxidase
MNDKKQKVAVIVGAGPAGLTAAYELLKKTNIHPIVLESTSTIGGISQTVKYKGNRIDIGGHRFFSKNTEVTEWWNNIMQLQGKPSKDDILLEVKDKPYAPDGPDPEKEDRVMLIRNRVSRIFFLRKFFDYPISLKLETFTNMGLIHTMESGFSFIGSMFRKLPETSLENFYVNRFGRHLYRLFFEGYTEKVWGIHPSKLGADWGSQRVKGLSVTAVVKDMIMKKFGTKNNENTETSLIEQFIYPKYGPGQLWETVAQEVVTMGGEVFKEYEVVDLFVTGDIMSKVTCNTPKGKVEIDCDYLLSTMPIKDLVSRMSGIEIPSDVKEIAETLPYRDFITVGLCVKKMKIKNSTKVRTYKDRVPDTWIYIQERDVKIGRLQIFNNWSPYMVKDYENTMWIGLEYFCSEGDEMWTMPEEQFIDMAINELVKIDVIEKNDVIDACQIKVKKAYPSYYGSYYNLDTVKQFLNKIDNLFCLGRNGQHRYNNMDHSMLTAIECVKNIQRGTTDKANIWAVNTEEKYHESK